MTLSALCKMPGAVQRCFVQTRDLLAIHFFTENILMRDGAWAKCRSRRKGRSQGYLGRRSAHLYQLSPDLCLLSPLPVPSTWRRRWGWERRRAPVGICSPSLSLTHPGSERRSPWVNDQGLKQSLCALPASNYQDKAVRNNGYCRIAYSPGGFDPNPNEVGGKTPIDFNRLYVRLLACSWLLCR